MQASDLAATGVVAATNAKGFKLDSLNHWLNYSQYEPGVVRPRNGDTVRAYYQERGGWLSRVDVLHRADPDEELAPAYDPEEFEDDYMPARASKDEHERAARRAAILDEPPARPEPAPAPVADPKPAPATGPDKLKMEALRISAILHSGHGAEGLESTLTTASTILAWLTATSE